MERFNRMLGYVRQDGVSPAERDDGGFAEKNSFAKNRVAGSE
jgi:hypothetical protein